jgi:hypothetical protein
LLRVRGGGESMAAGMKLAVRRREALARISIYHMLIYIMAW